jgi:hypothetical protein
MNSGAKHSIGRRTTWLLVVCLALVASAHGQVGKKAILTQAGQSYYSLRRLGLVDLQATIQPNWGLTLSERMKTDPAGAQASLKMLATLHFAMTLDADGHVKVTYQSDVPPQSPQAAEVVKQIFGGVEQLVSGFFEAWSPFMVKSPFEQVDAAYQLEDNGKQYRIAYKDGDINMLTTMTKEFEIIETAVIDAKYHSAIKPQFAKTQKGFLLTGYEATFDPVSGPGKTHLSVQVEYQEVNGLNVPRKMHLDSIFDGVPSTTELVFSDYKIKVQ